MISLGNWSIRLIPENLRINRFHNYKEWFFIYYKNGLCGTLQLCDFDNKWWVHILNDKIRKRFYKDDLKFHKNKIVKLNNKYVLQKQNHILADELIRLYNIDLETKRNENNLYFRVIVDDIFDKSYRNVADDTQIISDIKKENPNIGLFFSDKQIKMSLVKIFQIQDLKLDLRYRCCKTRKSGILWNLYNL